MIKQNKFPKKTLKHTDIINDFFIEAINQNEEAVKCNKLWMYVIEQAISDALSTRFGMRYKYLRSKAIEWIFYDDEHFYEICYLAEVNPKAIREKVISIMKNRHTPNSFEQQFTDLLKLIDLDKIYTRDC